jgi:hypothetical protein
MQYRAGMIGASLLVQRDPAGGTSVSCSLPRPPAPAASDDSRASRQKGRRARAVASESPATISPEI